MVYELKLRKIGNSLGVLLPRETLSRLNVQLGDSLTLTENRDGFRLTANDPDFEQTMKGMQSLSRRYRNALHELSK